MGRFFSDGFAWSGLAKPLVGWVLLRLTDLLCQIMGGQHRVLIDHARCAIAHDFPDAGSHFGPIAVDGAVFAIAFMLMRAN